MKPSHVSFTLLAATLFLVGSVSAAQPSPEKAPSARRPARAAAQESPRSAQQAKDAEILKRFDRNGDGKLDEEELAAAKIEMLESGQEKRGLRAGKVREAAREFDANGDGQLDAAELAKLLNERPYLKRRLDKNGDGKVDEQEAAAARELFQLRRAAKGKER